jgi:hypothetical protein
MIKISFENSCKKNKLLSYTCKKLYSQHIDNNNLINKKWLITILRMFLSFIKNSSSFVIHYKYKKLRLWKLLKKQL